MSNNKEYYQKNKVAWKKYHAAEHTQMRIRGGVLKCGRKDKITYIKRNTSVCTDWANSYKLFEEWALSHGWKKGLQLDRIDNNGNYEPDNCRFVTPSQNCRNRSNNVIVVYNGKPMTLIQAIQESKTTFTYQAVWQRIKRFGWGVDKALTYRSRKQPVKNK